MEILNIYEPGTIGDVAIYTRIELDEVYSYKFWAIVAFAQARACRLILDEPSRQLKADGSSVITSTCRYLHIEFKDENKSQT